jgi:hypothetical protein
MDEADNNVSLEYIEQNWVFLEPVCKWLNDLKFIPLEYQTKELYELAVQNNGLAIMFVPEKYRTKELCKMAIKKNIYAIEWIPEEYQTKELYELAVQQNGKALSHVPDEFKTKELCKLAVKQNGNNLRFVPDELKSELQHYLQETSFELPINKYYETFREIKTLFSEKDVSLHYHHS